MSSVTIGCSITGGLILSLPNAAQLGLDPYYSVTLNGPPYSPVSNGNSVGVGFTEVDEDFWNNWLATYATNPIITNGSVWEL